MKDIDTILYNDTKNQGIMKQNEKQVYESPEIVGFDTIMENGFAISEIEAPDYDPDRSFEF